MPCPPTWEWEPGPAPKVFLRCTGPRSRLKSSLKTTSTQKLPQTFSTFSSFSSTITTNSDHSFPEHWQHCSLLSLLPFLPCHGQDYLEPLQESFQCVEWVMTLPYLSLQGLSIHFQLTPSSLVTCKKSVWSPTNFFPLEPLILALSLQARNSAHAPTL